MNYDRIVLGASLALVLAMSSFAQDAASTDGTAVGGALLEEGQVGLTFYRPVNASPRELLHFAKDLTNSRIALQVTDPRTGEPVVIYRDRFVQVDASIAVQGDEAGRKSGVEFLTDLDRYIGQNTKVAVPEEAVLVRTVRLRSLSIGSAAQLLEGMAPNVQKQFVAETGTVVLKGATAEVARAESLLLEVDRPLPQMTLHVRLIEATENAGEAAVGGDLGKALAGLMPGKQFKEVGRQVLRGAVAGNTPLELRTNFGAVEVGAPDRLSMRVPARSWDVDRRVLTLSQCEVECNRARAEVSQTGSGVSLAVAYDKESFSTDLALKQDQETVVGSLGANALLVVVRFTVD